jgi:hypothetical protein
MSQGLSNVSIGDSLLLAVSFGAKRHGKYVQPCDKVRERTIKPWSSTDQNKTSRHDTLLVESINPWYVVDIDSF